MWSDEYAFGLVDDLTERIDEFDQRDHRFVSDRQMEQLRAFALTESSPSSASASSPCHHGQPGWSQGIPALRQPSWPSGGTPTSPGHRGICGRLPSDWLGPSIGLRQYTVEQVAHPSHTATPGVTTFPALSQRKLLILNCLKW
jgi:hypothetical protein